MILFKTPVIRTVYSSIKQIMETVMSTNSKSFKEGGFSRISKKRHMGYSVCYKFCKR